MDQIMKPGIDLLWVFAGRELGNDARMLKLLTAKGLSVKPFLLQLRRETHGEILLEAVQGLSTFQERREALSVLERQAPAQHAE